jgi:hypothetical protein
MTKTFTVRTDVVSFTVQAKDADGALEVAKARGEWAKTARRERSDMEDGAWLTIFDEDGLLVMAKPTYEQKKAMGMYP